MVAFGFIVGTSLTTGYNGSIVQGDAHGYFAFLPSIVFDRDIKLENQFEVLQTEGVSSYPYGKGREGQALDPFPIAPALLWLPGYLLGIAAEWIIGSFWSSTRSVGYGAPAVWGAATASILFAGLGAILTRRLIASTIGETDAWLAVVATWLGTAALYYTLVTPLYSHAVAWFGVASTLYFTYSALTQPLRLSRWLAAGLAAGFMVAIRVADISLLIMPLLLLFAAGWSTFRIGPLLLRFLVWGCGVILGYLPQALTSFSLYGRWAPSTPGELGKITTLGTFVDVIFSLGYKGWLSWTPIAAVALIGLVLLSNQSSTGRRLGMAAIFGIGAMYLMDVFNPYGPGAAFGGRRYVSASPLLAIGLAGFLDVFADRPAAKNRLMWLIGSLVAWNLWLFVCYELLVNLYRIYPTLWQTVRFAVGMGVPQ